MSGHVQLTMVLASLALLSLCLHRSSHHCLLACDLCTQLHWCIVSSYEDEDSFNVSNIMFSVTFSSSIANLMFTLGVVGIDPVCSVVNTLEK